MGSMSRLQRSVAPALLAMLWLLAGCTVSLTSPTAGPAAAPPAQVPSPTFAEHDLAFETIERNDYSPYYSSHLREPQRAFLISTAAQVAQLAGWVRPKAESDLAQLDYQRYFVIALFRGTVGSSGYDVVIQRVVRRNDRLIIYVQFWEPSPYYAVTAAMSYPYHVIRVLRDGGPLQEAELVLESQTVTPTPPPEVRRLTPTPSARQ